MKQYLRFSLIIIFLAAIQILFAQSLEQNSTEATAYDGYTLMWSDEFSTNGAVDADKWHHQTILPDGYPNGFAWYNGEKQHYTDRIENSSVDNGFLKITAIKEQFSDQGHTKSYTSARLNSKFAFTYGRVDVRAKLPSGDGTWPAIWMLGQNVTEPGGYWSTTHGTTPWPACGEIDIMEHWGNIQDEIHTSIHTPSSSGATVNTKKAIFSDVSNKHYIYSIIWDENKIEFLIDGTSFYTYQPADKNDATWPFDKPQYLLLNVAMGSSWYSIDPNFSSSSMEIDYVRVYQKSQEALQVSAPDPVQEQENVISLFSNVYDNLTIEKWLADWSVGNLEDLSIDGNDVKKYTDVSYVGIEQISNPIDISEMTHFHMDVYGQNTNTFRVKLVDFGANGIYDETGGDDSESEITFDTPTLDEWTPYDLPIEDFAALTNTTNLAQIVLSSAPTGESSFYIDNLYFYKEVEDMVPPAPLSAEDASQPALSVFDHNLLVRWDNANPLRALQVYNLSGQVLFYQEDLRPNLQQIQVPFTEPGIYIVRMYTEHEIIIKKLAVK